MVEQEHTVNTGNEDVEPLLGKSEVATKGYSSKRSKEPACTIIRARHALALMAFSGFFNVYALRVNLSVALVDMVNGSNHASSSNFTDDCPDRSDNSSTTHHEGEFNWDSKTQGVILASFFYGYIFTQIPGGRLAEKFSPKRLYGFGVLCTIIFTLLTPLAARLSTKTFVACRVLEGFGEGVTFPSMHALWANWAPPLERSKLITFSYSGTAFGTIISLPVSGLLCDYFGWPSVFYVFGGIGFLWFILWMLLVHDTPQQHPRISSEELHLLTTTIGQVSDTRKKKHVPWRSICTSLPVLAICVSHVCQNWGFYTLLTCLPTYMKEVLKFDISKDGFLSALPYVFQWFVTIIGGQAADFFRQRHIISTTAVRKLWNTIGMTLPAVFLVVISYVGCNSTAAVACLTAAVGLNGFAGSGYNVNHLDIAPAFAGTLMGITNTFATLSGIFAPMVVGVLTEDNSGRGQWQIVFYISAAINIFGALFFLIFSSGVEQAWAQNQQVDFKASKRRKLSDDEYEGSPEIPGLIQNSD